MEVLEIYFTVKKQAIPFYVTCRSELDQKNNVSLNIFLNYSHEEISFKSFFKAYIKKDLAHLNSG